MVLNSSPPAPPDSEYSGMMALLPTQLRPFAALARFDRPIGSWLLYWPCLFAMALAGGLIREWRLALWFLLGAVVMRGAGCVYNDILDRKLDASVARTASRPLASGVVSVKAAWIWLVLLCAVGSVVLLKLRLEAQLVALCSLVLVAAYPMMKRITWWPQVWLGMVFSWGALVGWVALFGQVDAAMLWLYAGCIFWVVGYDTIYAMQDREDDALVGIRSSALRMGDYVHSGVALCYTAALICWGLAIWQIRPQGQAMVALIPTLIHFIWQIMHLDNKAQNALQIFRSNKFAGLLATLGFFVVGASA